MNPNEISLIMEAEFGFLGKPARAGIGTIYIDEANDSYIILQPASEVHFAAGYAHEIVIYYYGDTYRIVKDVAGKCCTDPYDIQSEYPDAPNGIIVKADHYIPKGDFEPFAMWLNEDDNVLLIFPLDMMERYTMELTDAGFYELEAPIYNNIDEIQDEQN